MQFVWVLVVSSSQMYRADVRGPHFFYSVLRQIQKNHHLKQWYLFLITWFGNFFRVFSIICSSDTLLQYLLSCFRYFSLIISLILSSRRMKRSRKLNEIVSLPGLLRASQWRKNETIFLSGNNKNFTNLKPSFLKTPSLVDRDLLDRVHSRCSLL